MDFHYITWIRKLVKSFYSGTAQMLLVIILVSTRHLQGNAAHLFVIIVFLVYTCISAYVCFLFFLVILFGMMSSIYDYEVLCFVIG